MVYITSMFKKSSHLENILDKLYIIFLLIFIVISIPIFLNYHNTILFILINFLIYQITIFL